MAYDIRLVEILTASTVPQLYIHSDRVSVGAEELRNTRTLSRTMVFRRATLGTLVR